MLVLPSSEYWMLYLYKVYSRGLHNGLLCNAPTLLGVVTFERKKKSPVTVTYLKPVAQVLT